MISVSPLSWLSLSPKLSNRFPFFRLLPSSQKDSSLFGNCLRNWRNPVGILTCIALNLDVLLLLRFTVKWISEHCTALQFNSSLPGRLWMEASRSSKESEFWILTASNGRRCFCRSGMWGWLGWGWSRATRADFLPKTSQLPKNWHRASILGRESFMITNIQSSSHRCLVFCEGVFFWNDFDLETKSVVLSVLWRIWCQYAKPSSL